MLIISLNILSSYTVCTFQSLHNKALQIVHMLGILCFRVATSIPATLHYKDGRIVVLGTDPVQQHPQTEVFCLAEAQTVIDQLKTKSRSMRQGKEVGCPINIHALSLREGRQSVGQIVFHAGWIVSVHKQRTGEPAEHEVQRTLAGSAVLLPGSARLDPVGGQSHGH